MIQNFVAAIGQVSEQLQKYIQGSHHVPALLLAQNILCSSTIMINPLRKSSHHTRNISVPEKYRHPQPYIVS
jgi:hypothetical protein